MEKKKHEPIKWSEIANDKAVLFALKSKQSNNGRKHNAEEVKESAKRSKLFGRPKA